MNKYTFEINKPVANDVNLLVNTSDTIDGDIRWYQLLLNSGSYINSIGSIKNFFSYMWIFEDLWIYDFLIFSNSVSDNGILFIKK